MKNRWFSLVAGLTILVLGIWGGNLSALGPTLAGKIAYNCGGNICVLDLTTGIDTVVTNSGSAEANPKISPDGTRIAFNSGGVYVMNLDGSNRQLLSSLGGGPPSWSPDGTHVAFSVSSKTSKSSNGIWIVDATGTGQASHLTSFGNWPAWSPDGTQMTLSYNNEIWLMYVATPSSAHQVSACARAAGGISGGVIDVVWSPGPKILFAGFVDAKSSYELFTCDPTVGLTRLTTSSRYDYEPSWSPSGSMIAWSSGRTPAGIWVMNADGTSPQPIIAGGRQPSWGP